jgi:hypothetical protein
MLARIGVGDIPVGVNNTVLPVSVARPVTALPVSSVPTGVAAIGSGVSASNYTFDSDGLANDPRLPVSLQNLTYGQLQTALSPDPTGENALQASLDSLNTSVQSGLDCDGTNCGAGISTGILSTIPTWAWVALAAGAVFLIEEMR